MRLKAFQKLSVPPEIRGLFSLRFTGRLCMFVCFCFVSCKTVETDLSTYTGPQLIFGSGGGFTGAAKSYALIENGQLFAIDDLAQDTITLTTIKKNKAQNLFAQYNQLALQEMSFNHPGNLYYYIEHKVGNQEDRITWGDAQFTLPDSVVNFYQELKNAVPVIQQ